MRSGSRRQKDPSIREVEELRERLGQAERIGVLGEMASSIAHEVNQPLTAIANYASAARRFVLDGTAEPAEMVELLDKIAAQAERAGKVIRGVRSRSRRHEIARETLDCPGLIQQALRLVETELEARGWRLLLQLAPALPPVAGEALQIQQVLMNLLRNAIEAMDESAHGDVLELWARPAAGWLEIGVSDCGPGLAPEAQAHLFEPFFTTRPQGLGLGLPICRSIMAAHGGTLEYRHNQHGGAEFVLKLPVAE